MPTFKSEKHLPPLNVTPGLVESIAEVLNDESNWKGAADTGFSTRKLTIKRKDEEYTDSFPFNISDDDLAGRINYVELRWQPTGGGFSSGVRIRLDQSSMFSAVEVEIVSDKPRDAALSLMDTVLRCVHGQRTHRYVLHNPILYSVYAIVFTISVYTALALNSRKGDVAAAVVLNYFFFAAFAYYQLTRVFPYNVFSSRRVENLADAKKRLTWIFVSLLLGTVFTRFVLPVLLDKPK